MADVALRELVERARAGDAAAFEALYDRFERGTYGLCRRLLTSDEAAADAAQTVWITVFERLSSLRHPEAFSGWLRQVVTHVCRRQVRRRRWWQVWSETGPEADLDDPAGPAELPGPEAALVQADLSRVVVAALERLSPEHREVVVLHHLEGLGLSEIATALGVATGTVKSRLGRAREHLARLLAPSAEELT